MQNLNQIRLFDVSWFLLIKLAQHAYVIERSWLNKIFKSNYNIKIFDNNTTKTKS